MTQNIGIDFETLFQEGYTVFRHPVITESHIKTLDSQTRSPSQVASGASGLRSCEQAWLDTGIIPDIDQWQESIRGSLSNAGRIGLTWCETQYAVYPIGGYFRRHIDTPQSHSTRTFTMVSFLTQDWTQQDGGQLRLGAQDIPPITGTHVLFFSKTMPHEVLETHRIRKTLTTWFHCGKGPL